MPGVNSDSSMAVKWKQQVSYYRVEMLAVAHIARVNTCSFGHLALCSSRTFICATE